MVMYKIDRRGGGSKNHILGQTPYFFQYFILHILLQEAEKLWIQQTWIQKLKLTTRMLITFDIKCFYPTTFNSYVDKQIKS